MQQLDLIDYIRRAPARYPQVAGAKEETTSRAAANQIETSLKAGTLRHRILIALQKHGALAPDQCATLIGEIYANVRPRFTELSSPVRGKDGSLIRPALIERTGRTVLSENGNQQHVYRLIKI